MFTLPVTEPAFRSTYPDEKVSFYCSFFSVLSIFRLNSKFAPLLTNLLLCRVFTVRKLAASALVLFMETEKQESFIRTLTLQINDTILSHNTIHGSFLVLKKLIEMNEDDSRFAEFLSSNEILSISDAYLSLGLNAEPMASSVIFEILALVIPRINKEDPVAKGIFFRFMQLQ